MKKTERKWVGLIILLVCSIGLVVAALVYKGKNQGTSVSSYLSVNTPTPELNALVLIMNQAAVRDSVLKTTENGSQIDMVLVELWEGTSCRLPSISGVDLQEILKSYCKNWSMVTTAFRRSRPTSSVDSLSLKTP